MSDNDELPVLHEGRTFSGVNFGGRQLLNREFVTCRFEGCDFGKSDLSGNTFMDCEFSECNLSLAILKETGLRNARFSGCKMLGVDFTVCNRFLFSFRFDRCILDYSVFFGSKLRKTAFTHCSLKDVEFSEADLAQSSFTASDLTGARFSRTNLEKADFREALNFVIDPDGNTLKRTRFSASNLAGLLAKYSLDLDFDA